MTSSINLLNTTKNHQNPQLNDDNNYKTIKYKQLVLTFIYWYLKHIRPMIKFLYILSFHDFEHFLKKFFGFHFIHLFKDRSDKKINRKSAKSY